MKEAADKEAPGSTAGASAEIARCEDPAAARAWLAENRVQGGGPGGRERSVGFVPTMGALHEGHLELVRRARRENELVVVSVFVNPLQFDDPSDLERYPRDLDRDAALLAGAGCDLVFTGELVGPQGFFPEHARAADVPGRDPGPGAQGLEGALRPGHFAGVATIVARLFDVVAPTRAYFGQKDFQQTRVVRGLGAGCEVVVCGIERESHGLARSSRNEQLGAEVRAAADVLVHTLEWGAWLFRAGLRDPAALGRGMAAYLGDHAPSDFELEYAEVRDPERWSAAAPERLGAAAVALLAVRVPGAHGGTVRLIDNLLLHEVAAREPHAVAEGERATRRAPGYVERPRPARLTLRAPAKVNPWLRVTGRRADGFHAVDLGLLAIDLTDRVSLEFDGVFDGAQDALEVELELTGPAASADVPLGPENLAWRALARAARLPGWRGTLGLALEKHTPSRAGLGGGSSDAAAAYLAGERLAAWLGCPGVATVAAARAAALAELGSDTVFFGVASGLARATGRGEAVAPVSPDEELVCELDQDLRVLLGLEAACPPGGAGSDPLRTGWLLVVTPAAECPTGAVFAAWAAHGASGGGVTPFAPGANDLQPAALAAVPELGEALAALEGLVPRPWLLAGSGSSFVVPLVEDELEAPPDPARRGTPAGAAALERWRSERAAEWRARVAEVLPGARYVGLHRRFQGGFHGSACRFERREGRG